MKDNLKKPCDECPFRKKSLKGWLGGETPQSTLDFVNGEADFACHKTRHKEESAMSRCKGFLMFTRKMCKIPKYNKDLQTAVMKIDFKSPQLDEILTRIEFIPHHTI